jgi:hypothetical protein
MLCDYSLHLLSLLPVVLILKHQHISLFHLEVECILEFLSLLGGLLLESRELPLTLLNNSIDIHEPIITEHLLLLLKNLCGSVNQYLLVFLLGKCLLRGHLPRLDDDLIELQADSLSLQYLLLYSRLSNEAVDIYLLFLAYSMCTVHCLEVYLRVPIGVIEDDMVCCHQVETQATCSGTKEEEKDI